jgi:hypothetical protein
MLVGPRGATGAANRPSGQDLEPPMTRKGMSEDKVAGSSGPTRCLSPKSAALFPRASASPSPLQRWMAWHGTEVAVARGRIKIAGMLSSARVVTLACSTVVRTSGMELLVL